MDFTLFVLLRHTMMYVLYCSVLGNKEPFAVRVGSQQFEFYVSWHIRELNSGQFKRNLADFEVFCDVRFQLSPGSRSGRKCSKDFSISIIKPIKPR